MKLYQAMKAYYFNYANKADGLQIQSKIKRKTTGP